MTVNTTAIRIWSITHTAMLCVTENRWHCKKADYNRNDCGSQWCHPKIFSFPKEKEDHRYNGNDTKYR